MLLSTELNAFRAEFMEKVPAAIRDAMTKADLALAAGGITERALKAGATAPDFILPDVHGNKVKLSTLLAKGPVVLSFYRGGWCPYCNLELRALQQVLPQLKQLGATLVAISPQTPDESLSTSEKNALSFPVLSDQASTVASSFGITFDLADELRPIYTAFNHALPQKNGVDSWVLPIPATYVIAKTGKILLSFVDIDYRNRLEPSAVITVLSSEQKASTEGEQA